MVDQPIFDCHVNIWEERHVTALYRDQMVRVRKGSVQVKADAETLYRAMGGIRRAIIFSSVISTVRVLMVTMT